MRIKEASRQNLAREKINSLKRFPRRIRKAALIIFSITLILGIILASIYWGMVLHKTGRAGTLNSFFKMLKQSKLKVIPNYFRGLRASPEHIGIDIKHMDYQKLAYKRDIALRKGFLVTSSEDYVPATIRYKDKTIRAKIRLKGDWTDGFQGDKWAFRIKISGDNTLFGMRRFSIHHPKVRNYIYEWILHQALKREGIVSLRYKFIKVTLNGKDLGIYALEEHFEKRLIEYNRHRQGPIIKFNEGIFWADRQNDLGYDITGLQSEFSADIDAFNMNAISKDPALYKQFIIGKDLLESFRRGVLPTHKVFDVKKLAKYFALSELMGGLHGASGWINLRFYYNPVTSLLEPIGFDANTGTTLVQQWYSFRVAIAKNDPPVPLYVIQAKIFSDTIFFEEYIRALRRVSEKDYLEKLFKDIEKNLQKNLNIIYRELPYYFFSEDIFYRNQKIIQVLLNPTKGLHAYFRRAHKAYIELAVGNIQFLPIEVLAASLGDSQVLSVAQKTILPPKIPSKVVDYQKIDFLFPRNFIWSNAMKANLKVKYRILGTNQIRYETVFPYSNISDDFTQKDFIRQPPNPGEFNFLLMEESTKEIFIKSGNWSIERNLIIPKGYRIICFEGVHLNILNSAKILSYSPFEFIGSEDHPIVICSEDSTGQGITIMNTDQQSILKYVIFKNLSVPSEGNWELTGAVTFYESPVEITHCQFLNNNSEDSLNIVRSDFLIGKSLFHNTSSDALDVDFSRGEISDSSFINCTNDAIDVSGSNVNLRDVFIDNAGDKGVSVGEKSKMTINTIGVKNVRVAIVSKDNSEVDTTNVDLFNCGVGFAVFQKKPEFGPASMAVNMLTMDKVDTPYLVENNSELIINGEKISSDKENIKEVLYR